MPWNTKKGRSLASTDDYTHHSQTKQTNTHTYIHKLASCMNADKHIWISQGCCCVSSDSVRASVSSPYSTCGPIISWHTYPPLNDFSSSPSSRLIKVESLMPFRDPTAFNCIHCHYENEWRQLRTQMFFHIMTKSLLMCLVIFAVPAFDWRP